MQINEVEAALARLMPVALSQERQFEIEEMIDELAESAAEEMPQPSRRWWIAAGGMAAAVAGLLGALPFFNLDPAPMMATVEPDPAHLVLVGETDRVESVTDEGFRDADGAAMRAVRLSVVAENRLRDEETGIVMQVSEPREELLLTPISAF